MSDDVPDPLAALRAQDSRPAIDRWRAHLSDLTRRIAPAQLLAALCGLLVVLVAARAVTRVEPPPLEAVVPLATPNPAPSSERVDDAATSVVVHVAGMVRRPGLVQGLSSWRVADVIDAAGGPDVDADLDRLNLAALVRDGERVYVPALGEPIIAVQGERTDGESSGPVDLNRATAAQLDTLPGVGPSTAAAIVSHRDEHGPFAGVDALIAVRGIGQAKLEALREHVVVR